MTAAVRHEGDARARVAWVDFAKAWSIVLVVTMHSTLGVGMKVGETGWLHPLVAFAKPFRMPDFFLVAGLFASVPIAGPLRAFLDRKVIHFVYFYVVWCVVLIALKEGAQGESVVEIARDLATALIQPFSSLWFIYALPLMYGAARVMRRVPTAAALIVAAALHALAAASQSGGPYALASGLTGWSALDAFALFFVFFLVGSRLAPLVFAFAVWVALRPALAGAGLAIWALANGAAVAAGLPESALWTLPLGLAGAFAVVALSALAARATPLRGVANIGRHSLTIYLAFALFMGPAREIALSVAAGLGVGWISLVTTLIALGGPLVLERLVRATPLRVLFARPVWAKLTPSPAGARLAPGAP